MIVERVTGVEPAALGLGSRCSTTELYPQKIYANIAINRLECNFPADFLSEFPGSSLNSLTLCHEVHGKGVAV